MSPPVSQTDLQSGRMLEHVIAYCVLCEEFIHMYNEHNEMNSYLADPTSPTPSHCAVIILYQSVPVHQLS